MLALLAWARGIVAKHCFFINWKPFFKDDNAPTVRLCTIRKWNDFDGYGFNLLFNKKSLSKIVTVVEAGSPSEAAGLKKDDRLVAVNGQNVEFKQHADVVSLMNTNPKEVELLVVDPDASDYYKSRNIRISSQLKSVKKMENPVLRHGVQSQVFYIFVALYIG